MKWFWNWWYRNYEPTVEYHEEVLSCGGIACGWRLKEWKDGEFVYINFTPMMLGGSNVPSDSSEYIINLSELDDSAADV